MTLTDRIYAQSRILAGELDCRQEALLRILCVSAENALKGKLRRGICVDDCVGDFVAAASLYALAALSESDGVMAPESFRVGDVTVQRGGASAATSCLRRQAELMIAPYLQPDGFAFAGV